MSKPDYRVMIPYLKKWEAGLSSSKTDDASNQPANQDAPKDAAGNIIHTSAGVQWAVFKQLAPTLGYTVSPALFFAMSVGTAFQNVANKQPPQALWQQAISMQAEGSRVWGLIFKRGYWDLVRADEYKSQAFANEYVDFTWGSGAKWSTWVLQEVLNKHFGKSLAVDGSFGPKTFAAIQSVDQLKLQKLYAEARKHFLEVRIDPKIRADNLTGWLNRLKDFTLLNAPYLKVAAIGGVGLGLFFLAVVAVGYLRRRNTQTA